MLPHITITRCLFDILNVYLQHLSRHEMSNQTFIFRYTGDLLALQTNLLIFFLLAYVNESFARLAIKFPTLLLCMIDRSNRSHACGTPIPISLLTIDIQVCLLILMIISFSHYMKTKY